MAANLSSQRLRAVLAMAAVLGLGAAGTLALWSDDELSFGSFTSVGFSVASATTANGDFSSHDGDGNVAILSFDLPVEDLQLNQPVSADFWLRMDTETGASVQVQKPQVQSTDLAGLIDVTVTQAACGSPSGLVLQQGKLGALSDAPSFTLPAGTGSAPGEAQPVCIEATLTDVSHLPPGVYSTGDVVWEFVVMEVAR